MAHCHLPLTLWYHLGSSLVIDSVSDKALERGLLSLHGKKRCRKTNKLLKFSSEGVAKPKQRCLPLGFLQPEMQIFLQGKSCWQFSLPLPAGGWGRASQPPQNSSGQACGGWGDDVSEQLCYQVSGAVSPHTLLRERGGMCSLWGRKEGLVKIFKVWNFGTCYSEEG